MADNVAVVAGSYSETVASDAISSVQYQRTKVVWGIDGTVQDACHLYPLPVDLYTPALGATPAATLTSLVLDQDRNALIVTLGTGLRYENSSLLLKDSSGGEPLGIASDAADAAGSVSAKLRYLAAVGLAGMATLPAGTALIGDVGLQPRTEGGTTPAVTISATSTNATSLKASAGQVYAIQAFNLNAAPRYLKLYNKASAPTVGTDTPVKTLTIPGNTAGAGFSISDWHGWGFATGIAYALTTGVADADTGAVAANEIVVNLDYK